MLPATNGSVSGSPACSPLHTSSHSFKSVGSALCRFSRSIFYQQEEVPNEPICKVTGGCYYNFMGLLSCHRWPECYWYSANFDKTNYHVLMWPAEQQPQLPSGPLHFISASASFVEYPLSELTWLCPGGGLTKAGFVRICGGHISFQENDGFCFLKTQTGFKLWEITAVTRTLSRLLWDEKSGRAIEFPKGFLFV